MGRDLKDKERERRELKDKIPNNPDYDNKMHSRVLGKGQISEDRGVGIGFPACPIP